jgi:hypothetical protein
MYNNCHRTRDALDPAPFHNNNWLMLLLSRNPFFLYPLSTFSPRIRSRRRTSQYNIYIRFYNTLYIRYVPSRYTYHRIIYILSPGFMRVVRVQDRSSFNNNNNDNIQCWWPCVLAQPPRPVAPTYNYLYTRTHSHIHKFIYSFIVIVHSVRTYFLGEPRAAFFRFAGPGNIVPCPTQVKTFHRWKPVSPLNTN